MLTHRQSELLTYMRAYKAETGFAPTFMEIAGAMGLKSKSGVYGLLRGLEERGFIRRMKHRARAIDILPEDAPRFKVRYVKCDHCKRMTTAGMEHDDD